MNVVRGFGRLVCFGLFSDVPRGVAREATRPSINVLYMFTLMAAANASPRAQRSAIIASPLTALTGFLLTVDCRSAQCRGERSFAIAELAAFSKEATVGEVLRRMRCSGGCGGRVVWCGVVLGCVPSGERGLAILNAAHSPTATPTTVPSSRVTPTCQRFFEPSFQSVRLRPLT